MVLVFGTSTSIPDCKIGAVIIKMMSKTNTTSMNGIILISESVDWVGFEICISFLLPLLRCLFRSLRLHAECLFDLRGHLECRGVQALRQHPDVADKTIIKNYGGDGGKKSRGGGDQSFGNARRDGTQAGGTGGSESRESVDDAPNGAKEADKRGD